MLADELDMHLVSTGHLVRLYATGERRQRMLAGRTADDQEMIDMLEKLLATIDDNRNHTRRFSAHCYAGRVADGAGQKGRFQLSRHTPKSL